MKASSLLPLVVLLALGTLAPWAVEASDNGELELPWPSLAWGLRGGDSSWYGNVLLSNLWPLNFVSGDLSEGWLCI